MGISSTQDLQSLLQTVFGARTGQCEYRRPYDVWFIPTWAYLDGHIVSNTTHTVCKHPRSIFCEVYFAVGIPKGATYFAYFNKSLFHVIYCADTDINQMIQAIQNTLPQPGKKG